MQRHEKPRRAGDRGGAQRIFLGQEGVLYSPETTGNANFLPDGVTGGAERGTGAHRAEHDARRGRSKPPVVLPFPPRGNVRGKARLNSNGSSKGHDNYCKPRKSRDKKQKHGRFWATPYYLAQTFAWRQLSPYARVAWLEIGASLYIGNNNGRLAVSHRWLADRLSASRNTAMRAIHELLTRGFLEITQASSFSQKRSAAEFRFTHLKCDRTGALPSRAFEHIKECPAENESTIGAPREPIGLPRPRPP